MSEPRIYSYDHSNLLAREIVDLTAENAALRKALNRLIAAEFAFTKDTEITLEDEVADAVKAAALVLQQYARRDATHSPQEK